MTVRRHGAWSAPRKATLHQSGPRKACRRLARKLAATAFAVFGAASAALAEDLPSAAMMAPVRALATFMSTLPAGRHPTMLARRGLCIVENFAPFLFCGPGAAGAWEAGFRAHSIDEGLSGLSARFGPAHDFNVVGDRAYFSLPTVWTGLTHGRAFEEHGAWAFVVARQGSAWRILGYGWGVTAYSESDR